jgi:copper chaperone CopZ
MASLNEDKVKEIIEIIGMTCVGCARTLENEFRKFEGIDYSVSLDDNNITVNYSPSKYSRRDFESAIEKHGYRINKK